MALSSWFIVRPLEHALLAALPPRLRTIMESPVPGLSVLDVRVPGLSFLDAKLIDSAPRAVAPTKPKPPAESEKLEKMFRSALQEIRSDRTSSFKTVSRDKKSGQFSQGQSAVTGKVTGIVEAIGTDRISVNGVVAAISENTWMVGAAKRGSMVELTLSRQGNSVKAVQIRVLPDTIR